MSKQLANWTKKQYILGALGMTPTATMEEVYNIDFHSFINKNNPNKRLNSVFDGIIDARTIDAILRAKLNTIGDVMAKNKHELKQINGMGEKSIEKLLNFLEIMLTKNPHKKKHSNTHHERVCDNRIFYDECMNIHVGVIDIESGEIKTVTLKDIESYEIADGFLKIYTRNNQIQCINLEYIHGYIAEIEDTEDDDE